MVNNNNILNYNTIVIMYEFYLRTYLKICVKVELVHYYKRTSRWIPDDDRVVLARNVILWDPSSIPGRDTIYLSSNEYKVCPWRNALYMP